LHDGQRRKGKSAPPYIVHPFAVVVILSHYTDDENTIIAGLLHDTIEDTGYTREEMEQDFDKEVTEIVLGVTEEKERDGKKLEWKVRKREYIETLRSASYQSLMVSAADKIHNLQSTLNEVAQYGTPVATKASNSDEYLWFYKEVLGVLKERLDSDIVKEFEAVYNKALNIFEKS